MLNTESSITPSAIFSFLRLIHSILDTVDWNFRSQTIDQYKKPYFRTTEKFLQVREALCLLKNEHTK